MYFSHWVLKINPRIITKTCLINRWHSSHCLDCAFVLYSTEVFPIRTSFYWVACNNALQVGFSKLLGLIKFPDRPWDHRLPQISCLQSRFPKQLVSFAWTEFFKEYFKQSLNRCLHWIHLRYWCWALPEPLKTKQNKQNKTRWYVF